MLDALKKTLAGKEPNVVSLAVHEALQTEFSQYKETAEALLAVATAENEELKASLAAVQGLIAQAEAEKAAAEKAALEAKAAARKEKIVAAIGYEKADALLASLESLDDEKFAAVVEAMTSTAVAEASSKMFVEQGATTEVDASAKPTESLEMKMIKEMLAKGQTQD